MKQIMMVTLGLFGVWMVLHKMNLIKEGGVLDLRISQIKECDYNSMTTGELRANGCLDPVVHVAPNPTLPITPGTHGWPNRKPDQQDMAGLFPPVRVR